MKTKKIVVICAVFLIIATLFVVGIFWSKQNQQLKPAVSSRPPESIGYNYALPIQNTQTTTVDFIVDFIKKIGGKLPDPHLQSTLLMSKSGIKYSNVGGGGIAGIFPIKEGFAIPSDDHNRIVIVDSKFHIIRRIDVSKYGSVVAVVQDSNDLALLAYGQTPELLRFHPDGSVQSYNILLKHQIAPIGLAVDSLGLIIKYDDGGRRVSSFGTSSVEMSEPNNYIWDGKNFVSNQSAKIPAIHIGNYVSATPSYNYLSLGKFIGADKSGGAYVLVNDVKLTKTVSVDEYVWHLSSSNEVLWVAKLPPLQSNYTYIDQRVVLDKNAEPVVLVAKKDRLEFWKLTSVNINSNTK